ncbi:MAG: preprotein translocase subunit SecG [Chloroflexi bacterium]|nr:preprotein translocase subunit SecG [Chloroflexota bacterium]
MAATLHVSQIVISVLLVLLIVIQVKGTGSGFFGAAQATYHTRRGVEKTLFQFTIIGAVLFILISLLSTYFTG